MAYEGLHFETLAHCIQYTSKLINDTSIYVFIFSAVKQGNNGKNLIEPDLFKFRPAIKHFTTSIHFRYYRTT